MEAEFNRLENCNAQLRSLAMRMRCSSSETLNLIQRISRQSGMYEVEKQLNKSVLNMEHESFCLFEMAITLDKAQALYRETETEISSTAQPWLIRAVRVDRPFVYKSLDAYKYFTDYFKI